MIADEAIRLVEFIRENDEDRYEYLSSSIEELASGISDMKRMLEPVLDELEKRGLDIQERHEFKDDYFSFWNQKRSTQNDISVTICTSRRSSCLRCCNSFNSSCYLKINFLTPHPILDAFVYLFSLFYSLLPVSATPVECGKPKWSIFHETGLIV